MGKGPRAGAGRAADLTAGLPRLHVLVGDRVTGRADLVTCAADLLNLGAALHLRLTGPDRPVYQLAETLLDRAGRNAAVFINGRVSVALAAGARGVQLGRGSIAPADVRTLPGARSLLIGVSVHGVGEVEVAAEGGADFLVAGTLYRTPSHPGRSGAGPARIEELATRLGSAGVDLVPLLGIGGIDASRVPELRAAGAYGVVVDRAVWSARDPRAAAAELLERFES